MKAGKYFLLGVLFLGINNGLMSSTFNNFLNDSYTIDAHIRGMIEFPREFPGFILIFVTGLLTFISLKYWAVLVGVFSSVGIFGLGFLSPNLSFMIFWMFTWSMADHLWMPIESKMALNLADKNKEGEKLGQIMGLRNLSMIIGAAIVWITMNRLDLGYKTVYFIAGASGVMAAWMFSKIENIKNINTKETKKFVIKKKYNLFYALNILFGARKQLFLTFGPWLLIKNHGTRPETIALLTLIGAILGYYFRKELGIMVDKYGERKIFIFDAIILFVVCVAYAFLDNVYILYATYVIDNLMFAMRIARTTYLSKIAENKEDITPTISFGITIDHLVSMVIPILGGVLWVKFGYQSVFIVAIGLSVVTYYLAKKIKINV